MSITDYHFVTTWRFKATAEDVYAILADPADPVRRWPAVRKVSDWG